MKQLPIATVAALSIVGCIGSGSDSARLELNVETINFCERTAGETVVWSDMQLRSTGKVQLTISDMSLRQDEECAFQVSYPRRTPGGEQIVEMVSAEPAAVSFEPIILVPDETLLLRVAYTPSAGGGLDRADLRVTTNADNVGAGDSETALTVIPMCGRGVAAGEAGSAEADAGAEEAAVDAGEAAVDAGGLLIDGGTGSCPACGALLEKGAAVCES